VAHPVLRKTITFRCLTVSLPLKVKMSSGTVRDSALRRRTLRKRVGAAEATRLVAVAIRIGYDVVCCRINRLENKVDAQHC
jgi:hypothetical protein